MEITSLVQHKLFRGENTTLYNMENHRKL